MSTFRILTFFSLLLSVHFSYAQKLSGTVKDNKGIAIAYASIFIKNGAGTTADVNGQYQLNLPGGEYNIICQNIGYQQVSKRVTISEKEQTIDFILKPIESNLESIVVQSSKKDPSNKIIQNAINMKPQYRSPLDSFTCNAYIKMQIQSRSIPKRVLFKKIEDADKKEIGVDSTGKGMVYLSESLTQYAFKKPKLHKLKVLSGRESGSNGYGFNFPTFIQFYDDNVQVSSVVGSRGFVSPIADAAFHYYNFSYLGNFKENGIKIHRIRIQPKRTYEPLFNGEIDITDGDWHIFSVDVSLTKKSQLQLLDTLHIQQQQNPISQDIWQPSKLVVHFSFNILGFNMYGNALNVYSQYDIAPKFPPKFFDNIVAVYEKNSNNKEVTYWDSIRPIQLTQDEKNNYNIRDSIFQKNLALKHNKSYQDSIAKRREQLTIGKLFWNGYQKGFRNDSGIAKNGLLIYPILPKLQYNTVEGISLNTIITWRHSFSQNNLFLTPHLRYGFSNGHLNPEMRISWQKRNDSTFTSRAYRYWSLAGGKRLSQYNNNNPITPLYNALHTLFWGQNYMKLYENVYTSLAFAKGYENGFEWALSAKYENRMYVQNSSFISAVKHPQFTENYPTELMSAPFVENKAFILGMRLTYQPGQQYIQYPNYKSSIGSKMPTFSLTYQKGLRNILQSSSDFDKWSAGVQNTQDLKLGGIFKYKFEMGGFLSKRNVEVQDYVHFNGNQTIYAASYLNSFQLAHYYANSTTAWFYINGHVEHHFNGMLTNKIPLLKHLNWNLVAGSNAFYVNPNNNYIEAFMGIENIFKVFRVDFIQSFSNGRDTQFGVRLGFGGIFSNGSLE